MKTPICLLWPLIFAALATAQDNSNRHTWKRPAGDTVTGTVEGADARGVLIKREDGNDIFLPMEELSEDDQKLLNSWLFGEATPPDFAEPDHAVSANIALVMDDEKGVFFTGGSNRGWGARGGKPYALESVTWNGKVPFEVHEMRAKSDGFELTFTQLVDADTAGDVSSYAMKAYTYIYQGGYGSPEVDKLEPTISEAKVSADGKSVRLKIEPLTKGHVHELKMEGVRSNGGDPLLHNVGFYTLNEIPAGQ